MSLKNGHGRNQLKSLSFLLVFSSLYTVQLGNIIYIYLYICIYGNHKKICLIHSDSSQGSQFSMLETTFRRLPFSSFILSVQLFYYLQSTLSKFIYLHFTIVARSILKDIKKAYCILRNILAKYFAICGMIRKLLLLTVVTTY